MPTWKGTQFAGVHSQEEGWDPDRGAYWKLMFLGTEAGMRAQQQLFRSKFPYARSTVGPHQLPVWKCNVELPFTPRDRGSSANLVEEWTTSTELVEKDIFTHPNAEAAAVAEGLTMANFRFAMEEGVKKGKDYSEALFGPLPRDDVSEAADLYTDLERGVTGYETEYQTVTRTRRASPRYPWNRTIFNTKYIYFAGQLGIPGNLGWGFADVPVNPKNTQWGWRLRDQDFSITADRTEETVTWALSAWSLFLYSREPTQAIFA